MAILTTTVYMKGNGCIHVIKYIVADRPVAKRLLCKQRPLLGTSRNTDAGNNRIMLYNPLLSNESVNMRVQQ
jgi:hypothetical protein